jgi:hypothetical protein
LSEQRLTQREQPGTQTGLDDRWVDIQLRGRLSYGQALAGGEAERIPFRLGEAADPFAQQFTGNFPAADHQRVICVRGDITSGRNRIRKT